MNIFGCVTQEGIVNSGNCYLVLKARLVPSSEGRPKGASPSTGRLFLAFDLLHREYERWW